MKTLERLMVSDAAAWSRWLLDNGSTSTGVYLTLAKKSTKESTSLTRDQAIREPLCHGWIDGQFNPIDEMTYMQRYTPRTSKSIWSKRNVGLVEQLEREGRMHDSVRTAVESAKQDGIWQRAYRGTANVDEMQDSMDAVGASPTALAAWDNLSRGQKSHVYSRLAALKSQAGRAKHIRDCVAKLDSGKVAAAGLSAPQPMSKSHKRKSSGPDDSYISDEIVQQVKVEKTRSGR